MDTHAKQAREGFLEGRPVLELDLPAGGIYLFPADIQNAKVEGLPVPVEHLAPCLSAEDLELMGIPIAWVEPQPTEAKATYYREGCVAGQAVVALKRGHDDGGMVCLSAQWRYGLLSDSGWPVRLYPYFTSGEIRSGLARVRLTGSSEQSP